MSKLRSLFFIPVLALTVILPLTSLAQEQILQIKVRFGSPLVKIEGKQTTSKGRKFYFSTEYGGFKITGQRISSVILKNSAGEVVDYEILAPGEYLANEDFTTWEYNIGPAAGSSRGAAHMSWIGAGKGILMLDDLLPKVWGNDGVAARIVFEPRPEWRVFGAERSTAENTFDVANIDKAVFIIGKKLRETKNAGGPDLIITDDWLFKDEDAARMVREIFAGYEDLFGSRNPEKMQITISKFPNLQNFGVWEAETRGRTVTILSADMPFEAQSLQLLHEQLRHEIFHLWIPNNVNLSGNYDWFYEGFALYQALRTGVSSNRIRFDDMLDTLSRAYNVDNMQGQRSSLIEASSNRWAGAETRIYARGMIAAFLCDITMLQNSKEKKSISDILRRVYTEHSMQKPREDGNGAVLRILESYDYLRPITERYVKGSENIAWRKELDAVGLEEMLVTQRGYAVRLKVKDKLTGKQKAFLDKLGYNNWRKLSRN